MNTGTEMPITTFGLLLGFAAASAPIPPVVPATARETREEFERLAGQFKVLDIDSFTRDRPTTDNVARVPPDYATDHERLFLRLIDPRHQTASLLELLRHKNPRVRT